MCEYLAESKSLPHEIPVHVLIGITRFSVPEFVGIFELILNTDHVMQMESDVATFKDKRTLERVEKITLIEKNSFHSLDDSNTWNTPSSHNKLLGH